MTTARHTEAGEGQPGGLTDFERGVFGERLIVPLPLDCLVTLSQTRHAKNRAASEIKESIAKELHNAILVARLTQDDFIGYVNFINEIWRVNNDPAAAPVTEDGHVYLVIAGHTRVEAIRELADQRRLEGLPQVPGGAIVYSKIYENMTPEQIIAVQLDENIYHAPAKERAAMAIVETYLWGLNIDKWSNRAEFLRANNNKFNYSMINDALCFIELPPHIRDFVLEGAISYQAGVELGKTLPIYRDYLLAKYFKSKTINQLNPEELSEFEEGTLDWLGLQVAELQRGKFNITITRSRYESKRQELIAQLPSGVLDGQPEPVLFEMADPLADWRLVRRQLRDRHAGLVRELASDPLRQAATLVSLHVEMLGRDGSGILSELTESLQREYVAKIGRGIVGYPDI